MNNRNCIIIHGCPAVSEKAMSAKTRTYDKHWLPWLKTQLEAQGFKTEIPLMPSPWRPNYEKFKQEFAKYNINKQTVLVGHSCGCAFLVRWLGETKKQIAQLILVAPWKIPQRDRQGTDVAFYDYPIDPTIKDRVDKITFFSSDDEAEAGQRSLKIFKRSLGGQVIILPQHGHYTLHAMGTEEFPELLQTILD